MRFCIALGSNLGNRLQQLRNAVTELHALHLAGAPFLTSRVYETEPLDCDPNDPPFLNAVIEIDTDVEPLMLLTKLQSIEQRFGRNTEHPQNSPRTLDLDILFSEGISLNLPQLTIPHPRIADRRFVLAPLCDIRPNLKLDGWPAKAAELLTQLPERPAASIFAAAL